MKSATIEDLPPRRRDDLGWSSLKEILQARKEMQQ